MKQKNLQQMYGTTPDHFSLRVAFAIKETEDQPMVRKFTVRAVLIAAAILVMLMAVAYAAFSSQVTEFFGRLYGKDMQAWLEQGDVATSSQQFKLNDVIFTLDEVVYRNNGLYGIGTIRTEEGSSTILFPEDQSPGDPYGYDVYGAGGMAEKAPDGTKTYADMAQEKGGKLLMVRTLPDLIGVDGGELLLPESVGCAVIPQRDGSARYSFEASDGVVVEKGETYTLQMWVSVWEFSAAGEPLSDAPQGETWTVEITPAPIASKAPAGTPALFETAAPAGAGISREPELIVPVEYTQKGTLPVYRAIPRDFLQDLQPEWFNRSGILRRDDWQIVFNDEATLQLSPEALFYRENQGTFDAAAKYAEEASKEGKKYKPDIIPLGALSDAVTGLASWASSGWPETETIYEMDRSALTHITLEEAKEALEALMAQLGMTEYRCDYALDMSLERIKALGADMNAMIADGTFFTNIPAYDFNGVTTADEGYYLSYHKPGEGRNLGNGDHFSVYAYVTERGIVNLSLREDYLRGDVYSTPEKLVDYTEVLKALPGEMAASRFPAKLASVLQVRLTYSSMRTANRGDGIVLTPTWLIIYQDEQAAADGYTCYAEFDAVSGKLLGAMFK